MYMCIGIDVDMYECIHINLTITRIIAIIAIIAIILTITRIIVKSSNSY